MSEENDGESHGLWPVATTLDLVCDMVEAFVACDRDVVRRRMGQFLSMRTDPNPSIEVLVGLLLMAYSMTLATGEARIVAVVAKEEEDGTVTVRRAGDRTQNTEEPT